MASSWLAPLPLRGGRPRESRHGVSGAPPPDSPADSFVCTSPPRFLLKQLHRHPSSLAAIRALEPSRPPRAHPAEESTGGTASPRAPWLKEIDLPENSLAEELRRLRWAVAAGRRPQASATLRRLQYGRLANLDLLQSPICFSSSLQEEEDERCDLFCPSWKKGHGARFSGESCRYGQRRPRRVVESLRDVVNHRAMEQSGEGSDGRWSARKNVASKLAALQRKDRRLLEPEAAVTRGRRLLARSGFDLPEGLLPCRHTSAAEKEEAKVYQLRTLTRRAYRKFGVSRLWPSKPRRNLDLPDSVLHPFPLMPMDWSPRRGFFATALLTRLYVANTDDTCAAQGGAICLWDSSEPRGAHDPATGVFVAFPSLGARRCLPLPPPLCFPSSSSSSSHSCFSSSLYVPLPVVRVTRDDGDTTPGDREDRGSIGQQEEDASSAGLHFFSQLRERGGSAGALPRDSVASLAVGSDPDLSGSLLLSAYSSQDFALLSQTSGLSTSSGGCSPHYHAGDLLSVSAVPEGRVSTASFALLSPGPLPLLSTSSAARGSVFSSFDERGTEDAPTAAAAGGGGGAGGGSLAGPSSLAITGRERCQSDATDERPAGNSLGCPSSSGGPSPEIRPHLHTGQSSWTVGPTTSQYLVNGSSHTAVVTPFSSSPPPVLASSSSALFPSSQLSTASSAPGGRQPDFLLPSSASSSFSPLSSTPSPPGVVSEARQNPMVTAVQFSPVQQEILAVGFQSGDVELWAPFPAFDLPVAARPPRMTRPLCQSRDALSDARTTVASLSSRLRPPRPHQNHRLGMPTSDTGFLCTGRRKAGEVEGLRKTRTCGTAGFPRRRELQMQRGNEGRSTSRTVHDEQGFSDCGVPSVSMADLHNYEGFPGCRGRDQRLCSSDTKLLGPERVGSGPLFSGFSREDSSSPVSRKTRDGLSGDGRPGQATGRRRPEEGAPVVSLAWHPTVLILASGHSNGTIVVWRFCSSEQPEREVGCGDAADEFVRADVSGGFLRESRPDETERGVLRPQQQMTGETSQKKYTCHMVRSSPCQQYLEGRDNVGDRSRPSRVYTEAKDDCSVRFPDLFEEAPQYYDTTIPILLQTEASADAPQVRMVRLHILEVDLCCSYASLSCSLKSPSLTSSSIPPARESCTSLSPTGFRGGCFLGGAERKSLSSRSPEKAWGGSRPSLSEDAYHTESLIRSCTATLPNTVDARKLADDEDCFRENTTPLPGPHLRKAREGRKRQEWPVCLAWHASGESLVIGGSNGALVFWSLALLNRFLSDVDSLREKLKKSVLTGRLAFLSERRKRRADVGMRSASLSPSDEEEAKTQTRAVCYQSLAREREGPSTGTSDWAAPQPSCCSSHGAARNNTRSEGGGGRRAECVGGDCMNVPGFSGFSTSYMDGGPPPSYPGPSSSRARAADISHSGDDESSLSSSSCQFPGGEDGAYLAAAIHVSPPAELPSTGPSWCEPCGYDCGAGEDRAEEETKPSNRSDKKEDSSLQGGGGGGGRKNIDSHCRRFALRKTDALPAPLATVSDVSTRAGTSPPDTPQGGASSGLKTATSSCSSGKGESSPESPCQSILSDPSRGVVMPHVDCESIATLQQPQMSNDCIRIGDPSTCHTCITDEALVLSLAGPSALSSSLVPLEEISTTSCYFVQTRLSRKPDAFADDSLPPVPDCEERKSVSSKQRACDWGVPPPQHGSVVASTTTTSSRGAPRPADYGTLGHEADRGWSADHSRMTQRSLSTSTRSDHTVGDLRTAAPTPEGTSSRGGEGHTKHVFTEITLPLSENAELAIPQGKTSLLRKEEEKERRSTPPGSLSGGISTTTTLSAPSADDGSGAESSDEDFWDEDEIAWHYRRAYEDLLYLHLPMKLIPSNFSNTQPEKEAAHHLSSLHSLFSSSVSPEVREESSLRSNWLVEQEEDLVERKPDATDECAGAVLTAEEGDKKVLPLFSYSPEAEQSLPRVGDETGFTAVAGPHFFLRYQLQEKKTGRLLMGKGERTDEDGGESLRTGRSAGSRTAHDEVGTPTCFKTTFARMERRDAPSPAALEPPTLGGATEGTGSVEKNSSSRLRKPLISPRMFQGLLGVKQTCRGAHTGAVMALKWCVHDEQVLVSAGEEFETDRESETESEWEASLRTKKRRDLHAEGLRTTSLNDAHHTEARGREEKSGRSDQGRDFFHEEDRLFPFSSSRLDLTGGGSRGERGTVADEAAVRTGGRLYGGLREQREEESCRDVEGERRRQRTNGLSGAQGGVPGEEAIVAGEAKEGGRSRGRAKHRSLVGSTVTLWRVKEGLRHQPERLFSIRIEGLVTSLLWSNLTGELLMSHSSCAAPWSPSCSYPPPAPSTFSSRLGSSDVSPLGRGSPALSQSSSSCPSSTRGSPPTNSTDPSSPTLSPRCPTTPGAFSFAAAAEAVPAFLEELDWLSRRRSHRKRLRREANRTDFREGSSALSALLNSRGRWGVTVWRYIDEGHPLSDDSCHSSLADSGDLASGRRMLEDLTRGESLCLSSLSSPRLSGASAAWTARQEHLRKLSRLLAPKEDLNNACFSLSSGGKLRGAIPVPTLRSTEKYRNHLPGRRTGRRPALVKVGEFGIPPSLKTRQVESSSDDESEPSELTGAERAENLMQASRPSSSPPRLATTETGSRSMSPVTSAQGACAEGGGEEESRGPPSTGTRASEARRNAGEAQVGAGGLGASRRMSGGCGGRVVSVPGRDEISAQHKNGGRVSAPPEGSGVRRVLTGNSDSGSDGGGRWISGRGAEGHVEDATRLAARRGRRGTGGNHYSESSIPAIERGMRDHDDAVTRMGEERTESGTTSETAYNSSRVGRAEGDTRQISGVAGPSKALWEEVGRISVSEPFLAEERQRLASTSAGRELPSQLHATFAGDIRRVTRRDAEIADASLLQDSDDQDSRFTGKSQSTQVPSGFLRLDQHQGRLEETRHDDVGGHSALSRLIGIGSRALSGQSHPPRSSALLHLSTSVPTVGSRGGFRGSDGMRVRERTGLGVEGSLSSDGRREASPSYADGAATDHGGRDDRDVEEESRLETMKESAGETYLEWDNASNLVQSADGRVVAYLSLPTELITVWEFPEPVTPDGEGEDGGRGPDSLTARARGCSGRRIERRPALEKGGKHLL